MFKPTFLCVNIEIIVYITFAKGFHVCCVILFKYTSICSTRRQIPASSKNDPKSENASKQI